MTHHPLGLDLPITETEVEARIRLGRGPSAAMTAAGAAVNGVYHPPVLPYDGHAEDAVFQETGTHFDAHRPLVPWWFYSAALAAIGVGAWWAFH